MKKMSMKKHHLPAPKNLFFPSPPPLARLLLLNGGAVCLLLQCCFLTGPAGVARVRQPGPETRWFHVSGSPCLDNLPAACV